MYIIFFSKKFPNLLTLTLTSSPEYSDHDIAIEIKEDQNCKINKFTIEDIFQKDISFYCCPFKDLVEAKINTFSTIKDLINIFPIFNNKCNINFNSLEVFSFHNINILNIDFVKNMYNNMDCMPNLKDLNINCIVEEEIEKDFYNNFIKKILSMNLERINFIVKHDDDIDEPYSEDELKEIYPNFDFDFYDKIFIQKYQNEMNDSDYDC